MHKSGLLVFLFLIISCSSTNRGNQSSSAVTDLTDVKLKLDVRKTVFDNGLTLLVVENHRLPVFSFYSFYKVGSKYEEAGHTGAAHYLEHLMFKGTAKYGRGQFEKIIESNGGSSNAYTNTDMTVYYENMPRDHLKEIIDVEVDRMQNLLLDPGAFENERQVVLEERRYRYENSPRGQLYLATTKSIFKGTPYGRSVIGTIPDISTVSRDRIYQFFKDFYGPNNAVIVVAGDVDADWVEREFRNTYGAIPKIAHIEKVKEQKHQPGLYSFKAPLGKEEHYYGQSPIPMFNFAFRGEKLGTRRSFVMDILANTLGGGASSYLYQKFVKSKRPMLSTIGAYNYNMMHSGMFFLSGKMLKGKSLKVFKKKLAREFPSICEKAVDERSVEKAKNQLMVSYYQELQTNAGAAEFVGLRESFFDDYKFYEEELKHYEEITASEVKDVCRSIFAKPQYNLISVWNKNKKGKK